MTNDEPETTTGFADGSSTDSLDPSDYISGNRPDWGAIAETSIVALLLAVSAWFAGVVDAVLTWLGDGVLMILNAVSWLLALPFQEWPSSLDGAFESAEAFVASGGPVGFIVGVLFVTAFILFVGRLIGRVIDAATAGGS